MHEQRKTPELELQSAESNDSSVKTIIASIAPGLPESQPPISRGRLRALDKYRDNLLHPKPRGTGCHSWILSTVNLGFLAGVDPQTIHGDILRSIPHGIRRGEIEEAIRKVQGERGAGSVYTPQPRAIPAVMDGKAALRKILEQGRYDDEVDIWESSPIRIWDPPQDHPGLLLSTLYKPDDLVWIGERHDPGILGESIRPVSEWIEYFKAGGKPGPHIIPNPLTGRPSPRKSGDGSTMRGDGNIKEYRYCVVEFDNLPKEDQYRFWSAVRLPLAVLIDSGGKSIHAWLQVSRLHGPVCTPEHWQVNVKGWLYGRLLVPLGVDPACSNPARLSRMPGHFRQEKNAFQRLLWISPTEE